MDWLELESFGLDCPLLADELVGREALEGFEPSSEIVGVEEVGEVAAQLVVVVVVIPFDGRLLDCSVHSLDLAVRPGMVRLGQPMFDFVLSTSLVEHMHAQARRWPVSARRLVAELHAVVGQDRADFVWNGLDERVEKSGGGMNRGGVFQPNKGEL